MNISIKKMGSLQVLCYVLLCWPAAQGLLRRYNRIGFTDFPYIHPEGLISVPYGETLQLFCDGDAANLSFTVGGVTQQSEKLNDTTIMFRGELEKGIYNIHCSNKGNTYQSIARVLVDDPPQPVTDFKCISHNLDEFTCTWTASKNSAVTDYALYTIINGNPSSPCKPGRNGTKMMYSWSTQTVPRYRQFEKILNIQLKYHNVFGANEQNYSIDHYAVVKPAPVTNTRLVDVGAYDAVLQWNVPNNMVDLLPGGVDHRIEYRVARIDKESSFRSVDTSMLPKMNRTCRLTLELPYAHREYSVKISIRPVTAQGEEYWSDPAFLVFETKGKSTSEVNEVIYKKWRKSARRPGAKFEAKLRRMRGTHSVRQAWPTPAARPSVLDLITYLYNIA